MIFRTELSLPTSPDKINHHHIIALLGSCFSQNIGVRLQKYKFNCFINPFGTIFHPQAIASMMHYAISGKTPDIRSLKLSQDIYVHSDFHSSLGCSDAGRALQNIENAIHTLQQLLFSLDYVFITLGTADGYIEHETGNIVANCHKLPASLYAKVSPEVEIMADALLQSCNQWLQSNPNIKFVFTVSPVRHIKDGIVENALSKAKLRLTIDKIMQSLPNTTYFPAYEWMIDDLRDYRYYEKDLIHPNDQAIDYIWEKFSAHYFDDDTKSILQKIHKINQAKEHKPFNPDTKAHQQFLDKIDQDIQALKDEHPWIK